MKREAVHHTKMQRLCRRMDIPLWQAIGLLESIWHLTAREAPRGDIGKLSDEDIALAIDFRGNESPMIESLVACGWLDRSPDFRLVVHDWVDHADDSVHMRLARTNQYFVRTDGSFVRPKTNRLPQKERESAENWYSVHTPCARNGNLCASPALAPPEPRLSPALPSQAPPEPSPPQAGTPDWKGDSVFSQFVSDYESTGGSLIPEDFISAYKYGWKPLDWEQKAERVKALATHMQEYRANPRFVPNPEKFLKQEWKRPPKPLPAIIAPVKKVSINPIFRPEDYGLPPDAGKVDK